MSDVRFRAASIAMLGALVASCGNDGGEVTVPLQRFDTPESVVQALAMTEVPWVLQSPSAFGDDAGLGEATTCRAAATVTPCDDGQGTWQIRKPRVLDVDSPFTDEPFMVSTSVYDHCVHRRACGFAGRDERTGTSRHGCPQSEWSDSSCLFLSGSDREIEYSGALPGDGDFLVRGERPTEEGLETYERIERETRHSMRPTSRVDGHLFRRMDVDSVTVHAYRGHRQVGSGPEVRFRGWRGTEQHPYRSTTETGTLVLSGSLGYMGETCRVGAFTVETIHPIRFEVENLLPSKVLSGELRLSGLKTNARVVFSPDRLTVVDARGRTASYALGSDELRELLGACRRRTHSIGSPFDDVDGPY